MNLRLAAIPILALASVVRAQDSNSRWTVEFETGLTLSRYNAARVPNATGTTVDLADLLGKRWRTFGRVTVAYQDNVGGTWKLLYAPFRQSGRGTFDEPTSFDGVQFDVGAVDAVYQFNSYRLTYRKPWKGDWSIGGTLKIRDAEIGLKQGSAVASERNIGFVPLLNIYGEGAISHGFQYEVELDGLAGGPGRAIDLSFRVKRDLSSSTTGFLGYRILEGGADVPRVKNFAWVNYITVGLSYRF